MRAEELRIGNIIDLHIEGADRWINMKPVSANDIEYISNGGSADGIPLSPEWLERFGFDRSEEISGASGSAIKFDVHRKDGFTFNGIQDAYWYNKQLLVHQPKYVHQLQNLYFALTGKELELNP